MMHTGSSQFIRPSLGAWTLYGLGTENENLPGFIAIKPTARNGGPQNYGSAFLPATYQGTRIGNEVMPVANAQLGNIKNPRLDAASQRLQLDLVQSMNRELLERERVHPGVEGVIESYELAFRMQGSLPGVMDLARESAATKDLYGIDDDETADFGRQCLLARRFVEAGVRFVELSHGDWDQHRNLKADHARHARAVDQPIAGLLTDLKNRGLLNDTLVIWGGEFGRTPHAQNGDGRDHNNKGYSLWMAGGGVEAGPLLRPDRRPRLRGRREPDARPRLARHDPAPARPRPRAADLPLRRPRHAADRREGKSYQGYHLVSIWECEALAESRGRLPPARGPVPESTARRRRENPTR